MILGKRFLVIRGDTPSLSGDRQQTRMLKIILLGGVSDKFHAVRKFSIY